MIRVSKMGIIHVYKHLLGPAAYDRTRSWSGDFADTEGGGGGGQASPDPLRKNTSGYNFPMKFWYSTPSRNNLTPRVQLLSREIRTVLCKIC